MKKGIGILAVLLLVAPAVAADTLVEDFESYSISGIGATADPGLSWYDYGEGDDTGSVVDTAPVISGTQSFRADGDTSAGGGTHFSNFDLNVPGQVEYIEFTVNASTITAGQGTEQVISLEGGTPLRTMVEFYVMCRDTENPLGCDLKVRWQGVDSTGQILIPSSTNQSQFEIKVVPDWVDREFQLFVDAVDDGTFPFLEQAGQFERLKISQYRQAVPMLITMDDWTVEGGTDSAAVEEEGDIATGLKNFAEDIRFTTPTSLFLLALVILGIILAAVIVPLMAMGMDNTVVPGLTFFGILAVLWLVFMEWFPEWIGIAIIITAGALVSLLIRRGIMGIRDTGSGSGAMVAGALGYFIIVSSLLGFSGYATEDIQLPSTGLETAEDQAINATSSTQSFGWAVVECVVTLFGDCSQSTESETWATITDVAATVFNYARSAFTFLFQLLTFQLPIPIIFNVMIVLPPAAALATVGYQLITRSGT